ncbi:MAG: 23S rRNA (uracil(1939)-C(5))-methyltransferase RlmD [Planctomycetota bacterium]|jgi:23S rRNA (uracil-5-)-methyltransferase RumA
MRVCRHFGTCGGCSWQDLPYPDQVRRKEGTLRDLLGRDVRVRPSPRPFHYRTRMDYVFAWGKLGLHVKDDPRGVFDVEECLLVGARAQEALGRAREAIRRLDLAPYSFVSHKGYLRYVTIREAPVTGELMLVFLTNGGDPAIRPLLEEMEPLAESVVWSVTDRRADISFGDVRETRGRGWIEEEVGGARYRFGPNSFFQANPWLTAELYAHVRERVSGRTTDLYCGVGGIALCVRDRADGVVGLDNVGEAIAFADHNARANGAENVRFYIGDARLFLIDHRCDTLVLDPPRSGIGPKSVRKILRAAPPRVVYVSCNPKILAQELPLFEGYDVEDMEAFDLFPHTPHVEVAAMLTAAGASSSSGRPRPR